MTNTEYPMMKGRATSAMISLSDHLPQGGDVEEVNYEKRKRARKGSRLENNLLYWKSGWLDSEPISSVRFA